MPVNVGELLKERDRLYAVIEEAKTAKMMIKQLNIVIAMYGDGDNVAIQPIRPSTICVVPECANVAKIRGLCHTHYSRWNKKRDDWQAIDAHVLPPKSGGNPSRKKAS